MPRRRKPSGRDRVFSRGRGRKDYLRRAGRRPPRRTILVVCEGSQTEPNYIDGLRRYKRLQNVQIRVIPGGGNRVTPGHLIERAILEKQHLDWDKNRDMVWCVFDTEREGTHPDLEENILRAIRNGIHNAVSNPAFEYWYLLHFVETDRPFEDGNALTQMLVQYIPDYTKSMDIFPQLQGRTTDALDRAERLRARAEDTWEDFPNPSTGVDRLVRIIWEER